MLWVGWADGCRRPKIGRKLPDSEGETVMDSGQLSEGWPYIRDKGKELRVPSLAVTPAPPHRRTELIIAPPCGRLAMSTFAANATHAANSCTNRERTLFLRLRSFGHFSGSRPLSLQAATALVSTCEAQSSTWASGRPTPPAPAGPASRSKISARASTSSRRRAFSFDTSASLLTWWGLHRDWKPRRP